MKKLFLTVFILFVGLGLFAQEKYLKDIGETEELSKNVAILFSANKIPESFTLMRPYYPVAKNELDALETKTLKYMNIIESRFGEASGAVKLKNEKILDFARRETYIVRYENSAIRIIFTYFKSEQGWILNAFKWDDSFSEEFK